MGAGALHVRVRDPETRAEAARVLAGVLSERAQLESDPAALSLRATDPEAVARALAELARAGIPVAEFALGQPSLDEVFLALTGHPAEAPADEEDAA